MKIRWLGPGAVLGAVLTLAVGLAALFQWPMTEAIEGRLYDLRLAQLKTTTAADDIRLVVIDDASIDVVGRWPWPRGHVAELVRRIAEGGPRVIGLDVLYVDPDQSQGLETLQQLKTGFQAALNEGKKSLGPLLQRAAKDPRYKKIVPPEPWAPFDEFAQGFEDSASSLNNDAILAETLQQVPGVVLPLFFDHRKPMVEETDELSDRMQGFALSQVRLGPGARPVDGYEPLLPLKEFAKGASGLGHVHLTPDGDGTMRRELAVFRYKKRFYPSFSVEIARQALQLEADKVQVVLGEYLQLGDRRIPIDAAGRMLIRYPGRYDRLSVIRASELLRDEGGVPPSAFKNKIVIVGVTASGLGSLFVTPLEPLAPNNGIIASVVENLLGGKTLERPAWAPGAEAGLLVLIALVAMFLLPRLGALAGFAVATVLAVAIAGSGVYFFLERGWWLKIFYPLAALTLSWAAVTVRQFFSSEKGKERAEAEKRVVESKNAATNRQLGVAYQSQGLLDMAWDKFQTCPVDAEMKGVLYNLALDFERKRQFGKAAVVYDHIAAADPNFKDVKDRQKNSKQASETMIAGIGGLGAKHEGGTMVVGGNATKPTLGRYEIQRELGRGAMGVVYLGKDPKINRSVAIKTLRFDEDGDAESTRQVKDRFFREAESAGTLNHPNIIRIFDAGEDNDISFIAMELLEGEDLKKYTEKANLLPPELVMEYVAQVADALDYAHAHGVIHRDIKPANIMRLKDGSLRVTDFGIARITASSKTQTGTVLGTPSYMSPEQLAGRKVDGRSDLFSLGVMFYEMLSGKKPFEAESIATLLFKIANEAHPDPRPVSPERVSPGAKAIIDRALEKDPEKRYQRGDELARDIRECLKNPAWRPAASAPAPAPTATATLKVETASTPPASAPPAALPAEADRTTPQLGAVAGGAASGTQTLNLTGEPSSQDGTQKIPGGPA
jgi:serine/threonine-protein kinase